MMITVVAILRISKIKGFFFNGIIRRALLIGGFGLLMLFVSDLAMVKIQYRNHPAYINAYQDYENDPNNPVHKYYLQKERDRISLPPEVFMHKYREEK